MGKKRRDRSSSPSSSDSDEGHKRNGNDKLSQIHDKLHDLVKSIRKYAAKGKSGKEKEKRLKLALLVDNLSGKGVDLSSLRLPLEFLPKAAPQPKPKADVKQINFDPIWKQTKVPTSGAAILAAFEEDAAVHAGKAAERHAKFEQEKQMVTEAGPAMDEVKAAAREAGVTGAVALGTSKAIEKSYYRLHAAPALSEIRPPKVLRAALDNVKRRWAQDGDYAYACEQLKSIRQDLTVQEIRDALTIETYEVHGRISIEVMDWAEFSQCQTMLGKLYEDLCPAPSGASARHGVTSTSTAAAPAAKKRKPTEGDTPAPPGNPEEFYAYRLLRAASVGAKVLGIELATIPARYLPHPFVQHALAATRALANGHYCQLFKLYQTAPRMSAYLLDVLAERARTEGLAAIAAAYRMAGTLDADFAAAQLGLVLDEDAEVFAKLCGGAGVAYDAARRVLDFRAPEARREGGLVLPLPPPDLQKVRGPAMGLPSKGTTRR